MNNMEEVELRELNVPCFIRFSIRAQDTEENEYVHSEFKEYAKLYHRNDYTKALKELLAISKSSLWDEINKIRSKIDKTEIKEDNRGAF